MTEQWQMFLFFAGIVAAWSLIILAAAKWMINRNADSTNEKLKAVDKTVEQLPVLIAQMTELATTVARIQAAETNCRLQTEQNISGIRIELPTHYVRREDYIRHEVTINTKLDRLHDLIEKKVRQS